MAGEAISPLDISVTLELYNHSQKQLDVPEGLKCVKCRRILIEATQTECGCRYCKKCIEEHLKNGPKKCVGEFDDCQKLFDSFIYDKATNREISTLMLTCIHERCKFVDSVRRMTAHLTSCEYRKEKCELCGLSYVVNEKEQHYKDDCLMRETSCGFCGLDFTFQEYRDVHMNVGHEDLCSKYTAKCPYDCDTKGEVNIWEHRKKCKKKPSECPYRPLGCEKLIVLDKMAEHMLSYSSEHSSIMVETIKKLQRSLEEKDSAMRELADENKNLRALLESSVKEVQSGLAECVRGQSQEEPRSRGRTESVFRNGKFVWKIANFSKLKDNAIKGRNLTVLSDSFYTAEFGYKMCLKIYPNGDGLGKATHLSVFFVIMKGEFDDLLSWPFRNKVTLTILDDFVKSGHHSDTFKPDARSVCYQKPLEEFNIASGSPKFIPFSDLTTFLKNDTLYLQIVVLP